jgi:DNA-binding response OmpR family regulator
MTFASTPARTGAAPGGPFPRAAGAVAIRGEPAHLLVADDDAGMRLIITTWLRDAGHRVSSVEDGEAAWEVLGAVGADLLITDHDMPRLKGLELVRRIRAGRLNLPVILISGRMPWGDPTLPTLLTPGVALEKPFALADLEAHVNACLAVALLPRATRAGADDSPGAIGSRWAGDHRVTGILSGAPT